MGVVRGSPPRPALRTPWAPRAVLQDLVDRCRQSVQEHCTFSHQLLELRQWIVVTTQKLEAHRGEAGPGDAESQEAEFEVRRWFPHPLPKEAALTGQRFHTKEQKPPSTLTMCVSVCPCVL